MRHTLCLALFAVLVPTSGFAQETASAPAIEHDQILSANPFGVILKWINAEYEHTIGTAATIGVSASHFRDLEESNAAVLVRWYPQQAALHAFYVGARAGICRFSTITYYAFPAYRERATVLPGAGVEIGYNWLLGPKQNVSIGAGFGLIRIIGAGESDTVPSLLPSIRLVNVGFAF